MKYSTKILIVALLLILPLTSLEAAVFNPNHIISDSEMVDFDSFNLEAIQKFLESKTGTLKDYIAPDKDDLMKKTSLIIYQVSQKYQINPKYLLTLLQKEQSLIDDPVPVQDQYDWATGYAICDVCSKSDPTLQRFKGFAQQIHSAAAQMRYYLDHPEEFRFVTGQTYDIDGHLISPVNIATASLYNYTPHYHGNLNFWKIWQGWFAKSYPDGSLLQAEGEPGVWYIQHDLRRPILSWSALISRFDPKKIIIVDPSDLQRYDIGLPIKFPEFSLLKSPDNTIYLLVNDQLRPVSSMDVFKTIGFNLDEVTEVELAEIGRYRLGQPITIKSVYPMGALIQNNQTGGIYYVKDGFKFPVWSKEIM
ncbi:MAG TPA: hypothetical protein VGA49_01710, partial [Patescibacteria group bacterium]